MQKMRLTPWHIYSNNIDKYISIDVFSRSSIDKSIEGVKNIETRKYVTKRVKGNREKKKKWIDHM